MRLRLIPTKPNKVEVPDPVDRLVRLVKEWLQDKVWESEDPKVMRRWDQLNDAVEAVEKSRRKGKHK